MYKCIKISFSAPNPENSILANIQKKAQQLELEGTAQLVKAEKIIKIIVFGPKDSVDTFVDFLHKGPNEKPLDDLEIEPFIKDRDYRGAFRIIL